MVALLLICLYVYITSYIPGRIIVEKFNFNPEEKFVASFGVSFFIYFAFYSSSSFSLLCPSDSAFVAEATSAKEAVLTKEGRQVLLLFKLT